jgi:arylsulfatase A-like enzyme
MARCHPLQTGRYPLHNTINDWLRSGTATGLPLNETTMGDVFQRSGYATHAAGKWHLGFTSWKHTPTFRGYNSFIGFYSGGEDYFSHQAGGSFDFHNDSRPECGEGCSQIGWEFGAAGSALHGALPVRPGLH